MRGTHRWVKLRPRVVLNSFIFRCVFPAATLLMMLISCSKGPTANNSQASVGGAMDVNYSARIGVAVRTNSRTCVAVKDATLQPGSAVTVVVPLSPQTFTDAQVSAPSSEACPIREEASPGVSSYELSLPSSANVPKLVPLIAVVGASSGSGFAMDNLNVQADLAQTHAKDTFRACGASDGVHLSVWQGVPVTGTLLWTGHYSEVGTPSELPACTAMEMGPVTPGSR